METMMNKFYILAALFFTFKVFVSAQDVLVLTNGNMIEAKIEEISPTEIKYRRFDNLEGPLIIINKSDVFSIKYENGTTEVINPPPAPVQQVPKSTGPALDPDKLYFSLSLEPSGFLAGGPSVTGEFVKGGFNPLLHISFPTLALSNISEGFGMGLGIGANYFWNSRMGGLYLGGLFEWNMYTYSIYYHPYYSYDPATDSYTGQTVITYANNFILALNAGYKFVTKSGIYFRTGGSVGVELSTHLPVGFFYKPDVATGYIFNNLKSSNTASQKEMPRHTDPAASSASSTLPVRFADTGIVMPTGWQSMNDSASTAKINTGMEIFNGRLRDVLTVETNLAKGEQKYAGVFLDNLAINQTLKEGSGIRLKAVGDGKSWKFGLLMRETEADGSYHFLTLKTQTGRVLVFDIPFSQLKQPNWGKRKIFNKNEVTGIKLERTNFQGYGASTIKIFDIEVY
jgi:hypothetical protein